MIMIAKYAGKCRCGHKFPAGVTIDYAKNIRKVWGCEACMPNIASAPVAVRAPKRGSSITEFSSGAVVFTNRNGRCEDAPCCGCCGSYG